MQSVDFKCELRDRALAELLCRRHGGGFIREVSQHDTYFRVPHGRLRVRRVVGDPDEYAFYHRIDRATPTVCHFTIYDQEQARERFGARELPVWVSVEKVRAIYLIGAVTVCFDRVLGLGDFFEAGALVMPSQHLGVCHKLVAGARQALGPALGEPIGPGYCDLAADRRRLALEEAG